MRPQQRWAADEVSRLRELWSSNPLWFVAKKLGRTEASVAGKIQYLKLKKTKQPLAKEVPPKPWTTEEIARLRQLYAAQTVAEVAAAMGSTKSCIKAAVRRFGLAKIAPSKFRASLGSERIIKGYRHIKIKDTGVQSQDWKLAHHLAWESEHGAIPEGFVVKFLDGNRSNAAIENLALMRRADHLKGNPYYSYPTELRCAMRALTMFKRRMESIK